MNRVETMNRGITGAAQISELAIPPMKDKVSAEEWAIRVDLAAAYRLVAHFGWTTSSSPICRRAFPAPNIIFCSIHTS